MVGRYGTELGGARRWFGALAAAVTFGVIAAPAQGAYTATLTGTTATFTGDAAPFDSVLISQTGGELRHDRVDPGFVSSADFDSVAGGVQTLPDTAAAHVIVNGGGGVDLVQFGFVGTAFQAAFTTDGGPGTDFLFPPQGTSGADTVILNGSGITGVPSGPVQYSNLEQVNLGTAGDNDLVRLDATTGTQTNVYAHDGNDTLRLADGASLTGGTFRGGVGTDTLDYSAWAAPVSVDLGKTAMFTATLSGANEVPPVVTAATGDGLVEFTDLATNTFRYELNVDGLTAAQITDSHIHAGAPGVAGGVIFGIGPGAGWSDPAGPSTVATGQTDSDITEPALRAGNTYFNVHTVPNPAGEIRGQLTLDSEDGYGGPASGMLRALTVENVIGGSGADVLRGNVLPNVLEGGGGADTLTGGEGADTLDCGDGSDSVTSDPTDTLIACELPGGGPGGGGPGGGTPTGSISELKPKASGRGARITIDTGATARCPAAATAACTISATAKAKLPKANKGKTSTLGSLKATLAQGQSAAVKIKLSGKQSKLWRKAGKLNVQLALELAVPGGTGAVQTRTAKLKPPARK